MIGRALAAAALYEAGTPTTAVAKTQGKPRSEPRAFIDRLAAAFATDDGPDYSAYSYRTTCSDAIG